ncbi:glycosyltransferase [Aestuariivivens insulae]|uniref:glycosyltransferase n=1 Tax=Aestuariivivens insulae TaxID=1621988 RepID=UPI001F57DB1D|nr:glycosyltransferase [Aestuariivivens insulae]
MPILDFLFYSFIIVVCIQVVIYIFIYGKFSFSKPKKPALKKLPVSVIICAKNEAENLERFLPTIIQQNYPEFEIILINDASHDNTLEVMQKFAELHSNIKIVNVKPIETFWGNKKYALTLGIKASSHDLLLFTDADCKPTSKYWISGMISHFNTKTSIVLGFGAHIKIKNSFLNKLIRFETLITALRYFSFAKIGMPYMGVGRNLAYKKDLFFKANGFMNHMRIKSGDDDLFINQVATANNTNICFNKNSFTTSPAKTRFKDWFTQKRRHVSTAKYYKQKHKILLALTYSMQLLFWVLGLILLATTHQWFTVILFLGLRLIAQYIIVGSASKKLDSKDLIILIPFLEIFLISVQLFIFINNLISKPNHWK